LSWALFEVKTGFEIAAPAGKDGPPHAPSQREEDSLKRVRMEARRKGRDLLERDGSREFAATTLALTKCAFSWKTLTSLLIHPLSLQAVYSRFLNGFLTTNGILNKVVLEELDSYKIYSEILLRHKQKSVAAMNCFL
jgi:hypothetical protein